MDNKGRLEEAVLCLLCKSENASKIAAKLKSEQNFFSNRTNILIGEVCLKYIEQYKAAPGPDALDLLLQDNITKDEEGSLLKSVLESIKTKVIDEQFVLDQLDNIITRRRIDVTLQEALEKNDAGEDLQEILQQCKSLSKQTQSKGEKPLDEASFDESMYDFQEENEDYETPLSFGVAAFESLGMNPRNGQLSLFMAPTGQGKSMYATHFAITNLIAGFCPLIVSYQLSAKDYKLRCLQNILGRPENDYEHAKIIRFEPDNTISTQYISDRRGVKSAKEEDRVAFESHMEKYKNRFRIAFFPNNTQKIEELELYLDQLYDNFGFKPNPIILDYADLIKLQGKGDTWEKLGQLFVELKRIAQERNVHVLTFSQPNREGMEAQQAKLFNVAGAISKTHEVNWAFSFSRTPTQLAIGRMLCLKVTRGSGQDRLALITQNYTFAQFHISSRLVSKELTDQVKMIPNEEIIQEINIKKDKEEKNKTIVEILAEKKYSLEQIADGAGVSKGWVQELSRKNFSEEIHKENLKRDHWVES